MEQGPRTRKQREEPQTLEPRSEDTTSGDDRCAVAGGTPLHSRAVGLHYQGDYGYQALSHWGEGDTLSTYALGDVVWMPADCPAVSSGRVDRPGLHRVHSVFSIDEGPWFYYRTSPMEAAGRGDRLRTLWDVCSNRLHVLPDINYTEGWILVHSAAARIATRFGSDVVYTGEA